jgi:hypothetical protein
VPLYIYGVGRSCPARKSFTSLIYQDSPIWPESGALVRPSWHRSDRCTRSADLGEVISPSSGLRFGLPCMDLLDETYPMVKSKSYFVDFDRTGLTGGTHKSVRSDQTNFGCEHMPPYLLVKSLRARKHSQRSKLAEANDQQCIAHM